MHHTHCASCSVDFLSKFSPSPSPSSAAAGASFAGALVERMAGRVLVFFVRHASLLRPLSQAGKVQLAKVGAPGTCCLSGSSALGICCFQAAHACAASLCMDIQRWARCVVDPRWKELLPERAKVAAAKQQIHRGEEQSKPRVSCPGHGMV